MKKLSGVRENVLLKDYTTFKIGGAAKYFFAAKSKDDLIKLRFLYLAWMVPSDDHSVHEIMTSGKTFGPGCNSIDYLKGKLSCNLENNLLSHYIVIKACQACSVHLTLIGTGCIYSSISDDTVFNETSLPNYSGSEYSIVKGVLDQMIHSEMKEHDNLLHLRIRMPIDDEPHPRNLITKLTGYSSVIDRPNSMTVFPNLVPIMVQFMSHAVNGSFNMVNQGAVTHKEILDEYIKTVNPEHKYSIFTEAEQDQILLQGRSNNVLSVDKLRAKCRELRLNEPGHLF